MLLIAPRRIGFRLALPLSLLLWLACCGTAFGAQPAWSISAVAYPSHFSPGSSGSVNSGPGVLVRAVNIGDSGSVGPFRVDVELPQGLLPSPAGEPTGVYGPEAASADLSCSTSGGDVGCTASGEVGAGQAILVRVPVQVLPGVSGSLGVPVTVEGGGGAAAQAEAIVVVDSAPAVFELLPGAAGAFVSAATADGAPASQAGSSPFRLSLRLGLTDNLGEEGKSLEVPDGGVRTITVELPPGLLIDPLAVPACAEVELKAESCPPSSQVGTIATALAAAAPVPGIVEVPVFNMVPPPGVPASLGAMVEGVPVHLLGSLRGNDFGFSASVREIPAKIGYLGNELTLWGEPSDPGHDAAREPCLQRGGSCPTERLDRPFLRLPTSCDGPLVVRMEATSWIGGGTGSERVVQGTDGTGSPVALDGCGRLAFSPSLVVQPSAAIADSPVGLLLRLQQPQPWPSTGLREPTVRAASLSLPDGLVINPAGASGLAGCGPGAVGLVSAIGSQRPEFNTLPAACPAAAKVGTARVSTPLADHQLEGAVYLAEPDKNPFASLLALYVVVEDPATGIVLKVAGKAEADSADGRVTLSFPNLPAVPVEELAVELFEGPRALLRSPSTCGVAMTSSQIASTGAPEVEVATPSNQIQVSASPLGGRCPDAPDQLPIRHSFVAGTASPEAGTSSAFFMQLTRPDGSQRFGGLRLVLPPGLSASLRGMGRCDFEAASADDCPSQSRLGTAVVAAGAGPRPLYLSGSVYLGGSYRGAPLSLLAVVPVRVGPFDLGIIRVRIGLEVDPTTARVTAVSDPLPTIVRGIPLDIRDLRIDLDRPGFTRNPTSCDPSGVSGSVTGPEGGAGTLQSRFQVGGCAGLGFRPRLKLRLAGRAHRGAHPSLRAILLPRPGNASLRRAALTLPASELLDSRHIRGVCSRDLFAAGACPRNSAYGEAKVWSPLLNQPLSGPVYLRSSSRRLPDLAASLDGEVHAELAGHLTSRHGRIGITFGSLPDVPLSRVFLRLAGGRRGLLVNSGGLCRGRTRTRVDFGAQNDKRATLHPRLRVRCGT